MAGYNESAKEYLDLPSWIDDWVTLGTIVEVARQGCSSGAYMPAVTYVHAMQTMASEQDAVTDYLWEYDCQEVLETVSNSAAQDYSGICCALLSRAVDVYCFLHAEQAKKIISDIDEREEREEREAMGID